MSAHTIANINSVQYEVLYSAVPCLTRVFHVTVVICFPSIRLRQYVGYTLFKDNQHVYFSNLLTV
jgi:hypothetical protein